MPTFTDAEVGAYSECLKEFSLEELDIIMEYQGEKIQLQNKFFKKYKELR